VVYQSRDCNAKEKGQKVKSVSSVDYWMILSRIDANFRNNIRGKEGTHIVNGSELAHVINREVPYNPLRIMREASRVAKEAGLEGADYWLLSSEGAQLCNWGDEVNFYSARRNDVHETDADKLAALELLAQVCEFVKSRN